VTNGITVSNSYDLLDELLTQTMAGGDTNGANLRVAKLKGRQQHPG
jgi:hypothetical protein